MNKKLFSWKALAGLALLVAMGMTSCKNTTEVDPNDPYNTQKPVKPGTSTAGDADLTFTITNASGGDVVSLWNAWKKNNADAAKELMAEEEVTIALNFANYKLDGKVIALPKFLDTPNGSVINLIVSGFAEAKKPFYLDFNNSSFAGAEVNVTLLATDFDMKLDATGTKTTLYGANTTINELAADASKTKKLALSVGDGVTVKAIDMLSGALASADNVEAKLLDSDYETLVEGKGAQVGTEEVYVKSLVIKTPSAVEGAAKTALKNITIYEGAGLTLVDEKSQVESIVGLGSDLSKPAKSSDLYLAGNEDDFSTIDAISNVRLYSLKKTKVEDMDMFDGVVFDMDVDLYTDGADNVEFCKNVTVKVEESIAEVNFEGVNFAKSATLTMSGAAKEIGKKKLLKMFQYDKTIPGYAEVTSMDEDDLTAANASGDYAKFVTNDANLNTWKKISAAGITVTDKFHFATVESLETALKKSQKAYLDEGKVSGYDKVAAATYTAYANDWKALYGLNTVKTAANGTTPVEFNKATDNTNLYIKYKDELAFVAGANAAIDGSDWFEIYYAPEDEVTPELVDVNFDADCTIGGKAIDVDKLNSLISTTGFKKGAEPWFDVTYDKTTYEWKLTKSSAYLVDPDEE